MDQQAAQHQSAQPARGRSPSGAHHQPDIRNGHSPSPNNPSYETPIGLGLGVDPASNPAFSAGNFNTLGDPNTQFMNPPYDPNQDYSQQSLASQSQAGLSPNLISSEFGAPNSGDFSLFPPTTQGDQFNTPLFGDLSNLPGQNPADLGNMTSPQTHTSPTPPHMFQHPGSAHHSPSFDQTHFSPPPSHSRHTSLGPEAALLPGQVDWNQAQFQSHRRTPSVHSDVSSTGHSPHLVGNESFDTSDHGHSPLQRPQDFHEGIVGLNNMAISDQLAYNSRSPSHSPAISPRISPQAMPDMAQQQPTMMLNHPYAPQTGYVQTGASEPFPSFSQDPGMGPAPAIAAPSINIDFAPPSRENSFGLNKGSLDQDSLTPPSRGRQRNRAVTDPYNSGGAAIPRSSPGSLSPNMGAGGNRSRSGSESSGRSLSPGDRSGSASAVSRRRQSMTAAVPNNVIALRLADPNYEPSAESGGPTKRVQKHPATFQCTLCPKRFTRAYNLRSHLRTHTDERPFVCTVCGKAFARQHDRKRHEGLHSGEKKFVCKGDLKAGGQWGCGRRFARADALGRHFRSEAGRICIKPLLDEEMLERQRAWNEQRMQNIQNMAQQPPAMDPNMYPSMDPNGYGLPAALLAQYPALAQMNWSQGDMGNVEDDVSGRSSFDASDYDENDETGYVSGPGTGYGEGGMGQNFGEVGYSSDYGGR